jgi:hypothetical protein
VGAEGVRLLRHRWRPPVFSHATSRHCSMLSGRCCHRRPPGELYCKASPRDFTHKKIFLWYKTTPFCSDVPHSVGFEARGWIVTCKEIQAKGKKMFLENVSLRLFVTAWLSSKLFRIMSSAQNVADFVAQSVAKTNSSFFDPLTYNIFY